MTYQTLNLFPAFLYRQNLLLFQYRSSQPADIEEAMRARSWVAVRMHFDPHVLPSAIECKWYVIGRCIHTLFFASH